MGRLEADDFGRPGIGDGGGASPGVVLGGGGVTDVDCASDSGVGAKLDRARGIARFGGEVRSIADAERAGGGPAVPLVSPCRGPVMPGEAVCGLEGGGGGGAVFAASSDPACIRRELPGS